MVHSYVVQGADEFLKRLPAHRVAEIPKDASDERVNISTTYPLILIGIGAFFLKTNLCKLLLLPLTGKIFITRGGVYERVTGKLRS